MNKLLLLLVGFVLWVFAVPIILINYVVQIPLNLWMKWCEKTEPELYRKIKNV